MAERNEERASEHPVGGEVPGERYAQWPGTWWEATGGSARRGAAIERMWGLLEEQGMANAVREQLLAVQRIRR